MGICATAPATPLLSPSIEAHQLDGQHVRGYELADIAGRACREISCAIARSASFLIR
jgi:hypothetical protein